MVSQTQTFPSWGIQPEPRHPVPALQGHAMVSPVSDLASDGRGDEFFLCRRYLFGKRDLAQRRRKPGYSEIRSTGNARVVSRHPRIFIAAFRFTRGCIRVSTSAPYHDIDGGLAVRLLDPCDDASCQWADNPANYMTTRR